MLFRKELKSIPLMNAPEYAGQDRTWAGAQIVQLPRSGKVLAADFRNSAGLRARWFCDGRSCITWDENAAKFTDAYPGGAGYCWSVGKYDEDPSLKEALAEITGEPPRSAGVFLIERFIYDRRQKSVNRARQAKADLMREHFEMYPEYPANLARFCEDNIFDNGYIFFAKKRGNAGRRASCSHCGKDIKIPERVRSGERMNCPDCGNPSVLRGAWLTAMPEDKAGICIAGKVGGQLLLRWTKVIRSFREPFTEPEYEFEDTAYNLHLIQNGAGTMYSYRMYTAPYAFGPEWHRQPNGETCCSESYVYTENLREVFGASFHNVDLQEGLDGKRLRIRFGLLLNALAQEPKAEYLFKMDLPMLAAGAGSIRGDETGSGTFMKQMGVSRQYLPMYRELNITPLEHSIIRKQTEWVNRETVAGFRALRISDMSRALVLLDTMPLRRFVSYFAAQAKRHPKNSAALLMTEYQDYIRLSEELGVDLSHKSVRFPQDIRAAHQTAVDRYNAVKAELAMRKAEKLNEEFRDRALALYGELQLGDYRRGAYSISYPMMRTDLVKEGQSLNHCVGAEMYSRNHLAGHRMIFFIRKLENETRPFFTMELDMDTGKILQLYGFGDCSAPKDVRAFAEGFAAYTQRKKARKTA